MDVAGQHTKLKQKNPFIKNKDKILGVNSLHKLPALVILPINTQPLLTGSVEPFQFSPAEPVAYEGSYRISASPFSCFRSASTLRRLAPKSK